MFNCNVSEKSCICLLHLFKLFKSLTQHEKLCFLGMRFRISLHHSHSLLSSSKLSSFVHFQFSTIFGSKPNVQTNIELVKFFIALNIHLCSSLNCPYELWRNLSTIQKIIKVHFNPISQSYIQKLDAFWKREPLH